MSVSGSSGSDFGSDSEDDNHGKKVHRNQVAAVELELVERAEEAQRQVQYMQTATGKLKTRLEMTKRISSRQNRMKLGENSVLIKECNDLRRDNFSLRRENDHIRQQVKDLIAELNRAREGVFMAASESRAPSDSQSQDPTRKSGPQSRYSRQTSIGSRSLMEESHSEEPLELSASMPNLLRKHPGSQTGRSSIRSSLRSSPHINGRLVVGSPLALGKIHSQEVDIDRMNSELEQKSREMEMQKIEIQKLREVISQLSVHSGRKPADTKYYGLGTQSRAESIQFSTDRSRKKSTTGTTPSQWSSQPGRI